jgi:hypothetical protein
MHVNLTYVSVGLLVCEMPIDVINTKLDKGGLAGNSWLVDLALQAYLSRPGGSSSTNDTNVWVSLLPLRLVLGIRIAHRV